MLFVLRNDMCGNGTPEPAEGDNMTPRKTSPNGQEPASTQISQSSAMVIIRKEAAVNISR